MVQKTHSDTEFSAVTQSRPACLFSRAEPPIVSFPALSVQIDRDQLITKRQFLLDTVDATPSYLSKPDALNLLEAEKYQGFRLNGDLLWSTGARVPEVLGLTPTSFVDDDFDYSVVVSSTLKQRSECPSKAMLQRSAKKRYAPILDATLQNCVQSYLWAGRFCKNERVFPLAGQAVNRHIHNTVERVGGAPFSISSHTFRHSFAIRLLLHGRPLNNVGQLLGHRSIDSTEIYTNILTYDDTHLLEGVAFH